MSDEEKWVKAYEKLKKEGMLSPAVDYEELFAKSEFQGKKLFLLVSLDCARHEHGTENHPLCGWKINGYTNKKITIRFI